MGFGAKDAEGDPQPQMFNQSAAAERIRMTENEYLAFERASEQRHEYADGEIFAMSGGSHEHSTITLALGSELRFALKGRPCRVQSSDMRIHIPASGRYIYPDVSVVCGRPVLKGDKRDILLNPRVIVEVLSASTEDYDRGEKFTHYKSIPSLMHYMLASQDKPFVEVFTRQRDDSWTLQTYGAGEWIELPALECEIEVDQVYANVFDFVELAERT